MSMPDVFEQETRGSEVHTDCPFCSGEYVIEGGNIRHSLPVCAKFEMMTPHDFKRAAEDEERRKISRR